MDFTQDLSAFQGVLLSADNSLKFSDLSSRGGNLENIKAVISVLKKFLQNGHFLNENGFVLEKMKVLRKFAFYIILNSDLNILNEMVEMEGIDTVIWTVPTIPKCLMCEIIWGLHMDEFLFEVISLANPQLSLEVAKSFVDNIKYCTPTECLSKVKLITTALYKLICRLHLFKYDNIKMTGLLTTTFTLYQKCLKYYTEPPNLDKLFSEDELYKYIGNCLESVLLLTGECLDLYLNSLEYNCDEIYSLTCSEEILSKESLSFKICDSPVALISETLTNINNELLDKCKAVVMEVSVDIFCSWSEYEQNGKSVQETIGEICYNIHKKITSISSLAEHSVVSMLQQIARKPADYKDIVNSTDSNIIIEKINNNNEDKASWVAALIHKHNLCQDLSLIQLLHSNIATLNDDHCLELYNIVSKHISENLSCDEEIKTLAIKAYRNISESGKFEILENNFCNNCFKDSENIDFENMMTEIFNKLIAKPDEDLSDILCVFLQNPQKVYDKIFNVATESSQQSQIMLRVVKYLSRFSCHYYSCDTEPCIVKTSQKYFESTFEPEAKQDNFLNFISELKTENVLPSAKLLLLIVMPNLHRGLLSKDVKCIKCQLNLINLAYSVEDLLTYRAPMLAMLAQVLEVVRWELNTFDVMAPETVMLALKLQKKLFDTYKANIPEKESNWLKTKVKNLNPLNRYYYKELWKLPGENYFDVVMGKKISDDINLNFLPTILSKILCSSIQEEWYAVWEGLSQLGESKSLQVIHQSLMVAIKAEKTVHDEKTFDCTLHMHRNFISIIRYKYFKEPLVEEQVKIVMQKLCSAVDIMHEDLVEHLVTVLAPLLSFIVENNKNYSKIILDVIHSKVRHLKFVDKVSQMFSNGC